MVRRYYTQLASASGEEMSEEPAAAAALATADADGDSDADSDAEDEDATDASDGSEVKTNDDASADGASDNK